jgi:hypothetical protein
MNHEEGNKRHPNKGGHQQEQALHQIGQHRLRRYWVNWVW